ncbi:hypothetical protein HDE_07797 [Halotydeus destructor]|nr:hypothetical protein HDE_07797 [Halotydeus destructor]
MLSFACFIFFSSLLLTSATNCTYRLLDGEDEMIQCADDHYCCPFSQLHLCSHTPCYEMQHESPSGPILMWIMLTTCVLVAAAGCALTFAVKPKSPDRIYKPRKLPKSKMSQMELKTLEYKLNI